MMNHRDTFTLSAEHFDRHGNLLPDHVLYLAQKVADAHAYELGVGFENMVQKKLLWVITQVRYQVCHPLHPGESILVETWPLPPTKLGFERNFSFYNQDGTICIKGLATWVIIDTEARRLVMPRDLYLGDDYRMERNFSDRAKRLRDFEADSERHCLCPDESTIDYNGHVNNVYYAKFILDMLGDFDGLIDTFQIDYIHEVMCGQLLTLLHKKQEHTILVKGLLDENTKSFTATIMLK